VLDALPVTRHDRRVEDLELPDGTRLEVRPLEREDKEGLREGIQHLSPDSRYLRFFAAVGDLSAAQLEYLTTLDHEGHEALVAIEPATDEGIAVARYVVEDGQPVTAEIAVTVDDAWQGRGVGTVLLRCLTEYARERGVARFSALILPQNTPMIKLIESTGRVVSRKTEDNTVRIVVDLMGH
jgi:GNAT superfamily N-acetyltransferase